MCYYLALGIDPRYVNVLEKQHPEILSVLPNANPSIRRLLQPRVAFWVRSPGTCDCGFYYSLAGTQGGESDEEYAARFRRRRLRQGWSPKKVERALAASLATRGQRTDDELAWARDFLSWLRPVVAHAGEVVLVAHMYLGSIENEHLDVEEWDRVTLNELEQGKGLPAERLVHIVAA